MSNSLSSGLLALRVAVFLSDTLITIAGSSLCDAHQRQSVRSTSRGLILKSKQDRPIVTVVHIIEFDIADFVTASGRLSGKMWFQMKMFYYTLLFDFADYSYCQQSAIVRQLLLTGCAVAPALC